MRSFILSVAILLSGLMALPASADTRLAVGQVWTLKGEQYPTAKVLIGKLETVNGQSIVHITVLDVPAGSPPRMMVMGHMPYTESALRQSVGTLIEQKHKPYPDFASGYAHWQAEGGGYFTISVQEGIGHILKTVAGAQP